MDQRTGKVSNLIETFNCSLQSSKTNQPKMKVSVKFDRAVNIRINNFLSISEKFAVAGLLALFAVCASGSAVWPYATHGAYAYSAHAVHAPITQYSSYPAVSYAAHVAAPHAVVAAPHAYVAAHYAAPAYTPYAYAPHAYAAPAAVPVHGATYTAANRGSVHTAPLPGHALSQTSLNVAPAPGTL